MESETSPLGMMPGNHEAENQPTRTEGRATETKFDEIVAKFSEAGIHVDFPLVGHERKNIPSVAVEAPGRPSSGVLGEEEAVRRARETVPPVTKSAPDGSRQENLDEFLAATNSFLDLVNPSRRKTDEFLEWAKVNQEYREEVAALVEQFNASLSSESGHLAFGETDVGGERPLRIYAFLPGEGIDGGEDAPLAADDAPLLEARRRLLVDFAEWVKARRVAG
jgi:hypothetical protein